MKKTPSALQRKPRLSLNRETIQILNDPALLEIARGGLTDTLTQPTQQQESTSHQVGC